MQVFFTYKLSVGIKPKILLMISNFDSIKLQHNSSNTSRIDGGNSAKLSINKNFTSKLKKIKASARKIYNTELSDFIIYKSKKNVSLPNSGNINYNCKYRFKDSGIIACRHISHAFLDDRIGTNNNLYEKIKKANDFKKLFNDMGNIYENEIGTSVAHKSYICSFDNLGKSFHAISKNILEHNIPKESYFLYSENHAMAARFIKKHGIIKVDFYDPNDTCRHKNIIFKDLASMNNIRLEHLLLDSATFRS